MKERKLTQKQECFVLAYLETGNASEAYRRAYDTKNMQTLTINRRARELTADSLIAARIREARTESFNKAVIDRAGVLSLITEIATADASQLAEVQVRCCRHCWGVAFAYQWKNAAEYGFKLAEALDITASDLKRWERDRELGSKAPQPDPHPVPTDEGGYGFDVYASPNPECPRCLGEGHVVPVLKDTRNLTGAAKRLYAGFKQTKDGIEIKTRDQAHALALLAKEFKIAQESQAPTVNVGVGINAQGAQNVTVVATDPMEASRQYQELMKG